MINRHLNAPLHESEERPIDRAIMRETLERSCMSYKDLSHHWKLEAERLAKRSEHFEGEAIKLSRELEELKAKIKRYYKEIR